jgi:predicted ATPase
MVMNLFWESAQELLPQGSIRRVHFHEFMLGVHADLHRSLLDACVIKPRDDACVIKPRNKTLLVHDACVIKPGSKQHPLEALPARFRQLLR